MCDKDVCVFDLCDGLHMKDYYADWCPETNTVTFGGGWFGIPEMIVDHPPSSEEVGDWARERGG